MDTGDPNLGSKQIWWDTFCKFLCKMYGGQMHFLDQSTMYAFMIYLIEMKERRPILKQYYESHLQKSKVICFTLNRCRWYINALSLRYCILNDFDKIMPFFLVLTISEKYIWLFYWFTFSIFLGNILMKVSR